MASLEEIRSARLAKLKVLSELGIDPYPVHTNRDLSINEAIENTGPGMARTIPAPV